MVLGSWGLGDSGFLQFWGSAWFYDSGVLRFCNSAVPGFCVSGVLDSVVLNFCGSELLGPVVLNSCGSANSGVWGVLGFWGYGV